MHQGKKGVQMLVSGKVMEFLTKKRYCWRSSSVFVVLTLPFAYCRLLLLLRRFLGGAGSSVASAMHGVSRGVHGAASWSNVPAVDAGAVAIVSIVSVFTKEGVRGSQKIDN
jgi:hypothetical protein